MLTLDVERRSARHRIKMTFATSEAKTAEVDGARLPSAETLRREFPTLVFTPDRLAVVKGGPAVRRAYFDRSLARRHPNHSAASQDYSAVLAQRNAALRRVQLGLTPRSTVDPWTARIADLARELVALRVAMLDTIAVPFASVAADLGLPDARLAYEGQAPELADLEGRLDLDIARGVTGIGPHLHDVRIASGTRDLRSFGSQGEQRLALLALLLAEAELLPSPPLLLLDDVLSELDGRRRGVLAERVAAMEQTVITTTHRSMLPGEPTQVVEVSPGQAL